MENTPQTNKEIYLQKKLEKDKRKTAQENQQKTNKKLSIGIPVALVGLLVLWGLVGLMSDSSQDNNQGAAQLVIDISKYDAGTVSMSDDKVKHTYEIKNNGQGNLKISNIKTSCMCTTATLTVDDKTSPKFGMHDNPAFWSQEIAPGQTGSLNVTFDQAFHGAQGVGQVIRVVSFVTNDPDNEKAEVKLVASVIP